MSALESRCRAYGWREPRSVRVAALPATAARLWEQGQAALAPLKSGVSSLADWIKTLGEVLQGLGGLGLLEDSHEAGTKVLDALWLSRSPWPGSVHEQVLADTSLRYAEFVAWVDESLEAQQYKPEPGADAQVFITPLARAMLRPFGAVVLPGADAQTLGNGAGKLPALLSDAQARAMGLPDLQEQRDAQAFAFTQALRAPALTVLRCTAAGAEPLAASPLLDRLVLAMGRPLRPWIDARPERELAIETQPRVAALAPGLLPAQLSASGLESLRACPYQFFARVLLGLREQEELAQEADKRDYGTWLHAVLHRFHTERPDGEDAALLNRIADEEVRAQGLAPAEFLPFTASFERFVPRYLEWLREAEARGQRFVEGELDREVHPWPDDEVLQDLRLRGRIDRIDEQGSARVLLDYKTGGVTGLKAKVARPLEDTQLAVYAALMPGDGLQARYLALDDSKGIAEVEHPDVENTVELMINGVQQDLREMHAGAPLPALGEGAVCDFCEMRGLCRRDDWTAA